LCPKVLGHDEIRGLRPAETKRETQPEIGPKKAFDQPP
jgi:hypothetical protein